MLRIYRSGQLEYYHAKRTDEDFWEDHWSSSNNPDQLKPQNQFIEDTLFKFNPPGDKILEAGCGSCSFLYPMHRYGYRAVGLDFARKTLQSVKNSKPELGLLVGDLEKLPFDDSAFDGYWSIGVIEHFKDGYDQLLGECRRILRVGGMAYISFPYMNLMRKAKGKFAMYGQTEPTGNLDFYQYALDHKRVTRTWVSHGFEFLDQRYMFPYEGLKSGIRMLDLLLDPWHHHSIMLIFRKVK